MRAREFIVKEQKLDEFLPALAAAAAPIAGMAARGALAAGQMIGRGALAAGDALAAGAKTAVQVGGKAAQTVGNAASKTAQTVGNLASKTAQTIDQGIKSTAQRASDGYTSGQQMGQKLAGQITPRAQQQRQNTVNNIVSNQGNEQIGKVRDNLNKIKNQIPGIDVQKTVQALKATQDGKKLNPVDNQNLAAIGKEVATAVLDNPAATTRLNTMLGKGNAENGEEQQTLTNKIQQVLGKTQ